MPRTAVQRKRFPLKNLVLHFRPATVPEKTMRLSLTWGLGGMAATLIFFQPHLGVGRHGCHPHLSPVRYRRFTEIRL